VAFVVRWSRPCDQERALARERWAAYASHVEGTRAEVEARAVLSALDADLDEAMRRGESMLAAPEPDDTAGASMYREAMERLVLADGACSAD